MCDWSGVDVDLARGDEHDLFCYWLLSLPCSFMWLTTALLLMCLPPPPRDRFCSSTGFRLISCCIIFNNPKRFHVGERYQWWLGIRKVYAIGLHRPAILSLATIRDRSTTLRTTEHIHHPMCKVVWFVNSLLVYSPTLLWQCLHSFLVQQKSNDRMCMRHRRTTTRITRRWRRSGLVDIDRLLV